MIPPNARVPAPNCGTDTTALPITTPKPALGGMMPPRAGLSVNTALTFMTVQRALGGPSRFWRPLPCAYSRHAPISSSLFFLKEKEGRRDGSMRTPAHRRTKIFVLSARFGLVAEQRAASPAPCFACSLRPAQGTRY